MTHWTSEQHTQVETEVWQAYLDGYAAACADIAAGHVELAAAWEGIGRRTREDYVAARLALFERCAADFHDRHHTRERVMPG